MNNFEEQFDRYQREIFDGVWRVSINVQDLRSDEELAQDLDNHNWAPDHVRAAANEIIQTYITINRMVELWKKQRRFTIENSKDVKNIYDIINNYINLYISKVQDSVNAGSAPIDDLISLDELAHHLYPSASKNMLTAPTLMQRLGMKGIRSKQEILGNITERENKTAPKRYRLADAIVSLHKG